MKMLMRSLIVSIVAAFAAMAASEPAPHGAVPSANQLAWHAVEYYGLVCYGLNSYTQQEWGYGDIDPKLFNPSNLDTDQWARVARDAGMKGLILVAKHHDGFCLWPSKTTAYNISATPWKDGRGDVLGDLSASCKKFGLKLGVYVSPWDRNHAEYGRDAYVRDYHEQWREVLTGYGDIFEVWFDGANGGTGYYGGARERRSIPKDYYQFDKLFAIIDELAPKAVLFGGTNANSVRWVGNEGGYAGETNWCTFDDGNTGNLGLRATGVKNGKRWLPAEADTTLSWPKAWYYHDGRKPRSPRQLLDVYYATIGRNASLDLGLAIDLNGQIKPADVKALLGLKALLDGEFAVNLAAQADIKASDTRGQGRRFDIAKVKDSNLETYWATHDGVKEAVLAITFQKPTAVNRLMLQENIALGQRVHEFALEARENGAWKPVARGTTIGYKRLLRFDMAEAERLRLILKTDAPCLTLSSIGLYCAPVVVGDAIAGGGPRMFGVSKSGWKIAGCSFPNAGGGQVARVIDGDPRTMWHTHGDKEGRLKPPQWVAIDLGRTMTLTGFTCMPRHDGCTVGLVDAYVVEVSMDGKTWAEVAKGEFSNVKNNPVQQAVRFKKPVKARFVKFTATHAVDGNACVAICELGVLAK